MVTPLNHLFKNISIGLFLNYFIQWLICEMCFSLVESVKEQLKLSLENKNGLVQTGELLIVLDGLVLDSESLANCSSLTSKLKVGRIDMGKIPLYYSLVYGE